jgi:hypothetical protein
MPRYCTDLREKAIALRQKTPRFEVDFSVFGGCPPARYKKQRVRRSPPAAALR